MDLHVSTLTKKCYQNDPFVLASQVHQCFYVQDPFDINRHYVLKKVPRDLFNMGDQSQLNTSDIDDEVNWVREDMLVTIAEKPCTHLEKNYSDDLDFDDTLFDYME